MNRLQLQKQNLQFAKTDGVSANNHGKGFLPAFRDEETGRVELARFRDGSCAPMHLICGLPEDWACELDETGGVISIKKSIVAGFLKNDDFFTRDEAIKACQD
jgi:hypothetical protein